MAKNLLTVMADAMSRSGRFEYSKDDSEGTWNWSYVSNADYTILSAEGGYDSEQSCLKDIQVLKIQMSTAPVVKTPSPRLIGA